MSFTNNMLVRATLVCLLSVFAKSDVNNATVQAENYESTYPCTDSAHMLLIPGALTAGASNRACLSRFHVDGPAHLTLTLVSDDGQVTAVRELPPGDGGCVSLNVPQLPNTKAEIIVNVRYPDSSCVWERRSTVRISSGRVALLQTEKSRYRPGDTLRFRLLALNSDLTPVHSTIEEIWLEGPSGAWGEGTRVTQWSDTRSRYGLAQLQYKLEDQAPHGKWHVKCKLADGSLGSTTFWVGDYDLPPFQLSVKHAPKVLRTSERLVWNVCVRYPWSEAVEGMLVIRLRGAGVRGTGVRTAVRLRAPKACHRHAVATRRVGLDGPDAPDVVIADFSFQEDGTRVWQNTTVVTQVVDKRLSLEYLSRHRTIIAPGLPYKLKVQAIRWDGKPAQNERLKVCRTPISHFGAKLPDGDKNSICEEATTDARGVASAMFITEDTEKFGVYQFVATLHNDTNISTDPLYLPVKRFGYSHAAFGPISGDSRKPDARIQIPLYVNLKDVRKSITVHFVIISPGGTIYRWGATTQCPITSSGRARSASRETDCYYFDTPRGRSINKPNHNFDEERTRTRKHHQRNRQTGQSTKNYNYDDFWKQMVSQYPNGGNNLVDTENEQIEEEIGFFREKRSEKNNTATDRPLFRINLPIRLTSQMCPESYLIAYFYYKGELVSAFKYIDLEDCFVNKVQISWSNHQTKPGSQTELKVTTAGPSICALTSIDVASKWLQPTLPTLRETITNSLKKIIGNRRNMTIWDAKKDCYFNPDKPTTPFSSVDLAVTSFAFSGVRLVGGDGSDMAKSTCDIPAPLTHIEEDPVPRSDFAEAWLWRLVGVNSNGSAFVTAKAPDSITRYEATAVCVARNGIAVSQPSILQVFQEFFIHADVTKRLKRGDDTIIRFRIFNYLYEPLAIQIQLLPSPHLELTQTTVENACVGARSSVTLFGGMRARLAGDARISIRAKADRGTKCANFTTNRDISDEIDLDIHIEHEGVPKEEYKSAIICGQDNDYASSSLLWKWPTVKSVAGSEAMKFWAMRDVTGPLYMDPDNLVKLPRGCGEQNMARLATNVLAYGQLDPRSAEAAAAKDNVARGFARQQQFAHQSGGFSAFGSADGTPSTWLTAFAIRYLRRAHQILSPGAPYPTVFEKSERWLMNQQMENGCFRNDGQVFHRELKGALGEEGEIASVAVTAYVITSLIESSVTIPSRVLHNSLSCLRALPPITSNIPARVYGQALLTSTFVRLKAYEEGLKRTNEASLMWEKRSPVAGLHQDEEVRLLHELIRMAKRSNRFVWWETGSLSTSIEATSYAILAMSHCPKQLRSTCDSDALGAILWLSTHRNADGGFMSTQDTLVAMEALSLWSSSRPQSPVHVNLTVHCGAKVQTMKISPNTTVMTTGASLKPSSDLRVFAQGTGCVLVQATRTYNSPSETEDRNNALSVQVSVHTDGPFDCSGNRTFCYCAAVVEVCAMWEDSFPEMALLEVSLPGGYAVDSALLYAQIHQSYTLLRRIETSSTANRVTMYLGTRDGSDATTGSSGHQCYKLHTVGPKTATKPAYVKIMDYYNPNVHYFQTYTIPEECLPSITEEYEPTLDSDNIFSNAKSKDGQIIISDDISIEDAMPEFVPLDDPLYNNLEKPRIARADEESIKIDEVISDSNNNTNISSSNIPDKEDLVEPVIGDEITKSDTVEKLPVPNHNVTNQDSDNKTNDERTETENPDNKQNIEVETEKAWTVETEVTTDSKKELTEENFKSDLKLHHQVDNPNLADFHVINSHVDLAVPEGIEGPVPSVVKPPPDVLERMIAEMRASEKEEMRLLEERLRALKERANLNSQTIVQHNKISPYS